MLGARYLTYAVAGFHRYATYRQAMVAAVFTNCVFGFLRAAVLLAVAGAGAGAVAGYDEPRLATFVWVGQGLIGVVLLWGPTELADRIRSGDVIVDLLRPIDLVWQHGGLYFPLWFLPPAAALSIIVLTPFPSVIQLPLDMLVERGSPVQQAGWLSVQAGWAVAILAVCRWVQRHGERKLVVQGG